MNIDRLNRSVVKAVLVGLCLSASVRALPHEGMWLPTLLKSIEGTMRTEGLELTAEDLYSVNNSSLKDAIVLFGGGCTAEVISTQGLILTNHHCGYGAIQRHSSLEHDYLKNGFMAATLADELPSSGITATFIVRMEDVTERVLAGIAPDATEAERNAAANRNGEAIAKQITGAGESAVVRAFNYGNSWYLIVSRTFRDVRMVCAPPSSIGKFGGDTDNWMWPRHTGDFSVFRIYAGADNQPADYAEGNKPFVPQRSLSIDMKGVQAGDFSMIYGFPGSTQRYLTSDAVDQVVATNDPLRIAMREASLNVIDAAMRADDLTRIQYASKQSGISNSYKKWIGEVRGLKELDAVRAKQAHEAEFRKRAANDPRYAGVLDELHRLHTENAPYTKARDNFSEFFYGGSELLRFAYGFDQLVNDHKALMEAGTVQKEVDRLTAAAKAHFKNYNTTVDRNVFKALIPLYRTNNAGAWEPEAFRTIAVRYKGDNAAYTDALYAGTVFADSTKVFALLRKMNARTAAKLRQDPALLLARELVADFQQRLRPKSVELNERINAAMRIYVEGQTKLFPEKTFWPDANSTLRLSYGKVEGSEPRDGVIYEPFTTLRGVMEKYKPEDPEFELPERWLAVYKAGDFAPYGKDADMPVCFTSSLHTTGGNSGSPVLNARGELIGLNFDRTWESTMSDILFDPNKCRNIAVDIRYVLLVIDKVCAGKRLVDEMTLVKHDTPVQEPLPIR
ncbi:MAG TPA: S46 family peptidase [Flavobacteriales bacterium]